MNRPAHIWLTAALALSLAPLAAIATTAPDTSTMLAALRAASGGAHWNRIGGIVSDGTDQTNAMTCRIHNIVDVQNGRWRDDTHCSAYSAASGDDAKGVWSQDASGQVHALNSPEAQALAVTSRWLNQGGPLFPQRLPAQWRKLAPASVSGTSFARIDATPSGGRTVTLWINSKNHRLARTVMQRSYQMVTIRYSNYRDVDGLSLPFRITTISGSPAQIDVETVSRYRLLSHALAPALQRPSDMVTDVQLAGSRTEVPLAPSLEGLILVEARIDGHGPFPFALDSGGQAVLTPATAKLLGLKPTGTTLVQGAGAGGTSSNVSPSPLTYPTIN